MIKIYNPSILVLGAEGMLGRGVYMYLKNLYPNSTWGTHREVRKPYSALLKFDVYNSEDDLSLILKKMRKIDYIINCIGILKKYDSVENLIYVNAFFPHKLASLAEKYHFKLIHVSSDAVFPENAGAVTENTISSPTDLYGTSKLLGEPFSQNALTFRTSIIGFDPLKHKGLLEWASMSTNHLLKGYTNQRWTGCTVVQYAQLCHRIISQNRFANFRKRSAVFHFAPLGPISKYDILNAYLAVAKPKEKDILKTAKGKKITRYLTSEYFDPNDLRKYTGDILKALKELIKFEKEIADDN